MQEFIGQRGREQFHEFRETRPSDLAQVGRAEALRQPRESVEPDGQRDLLAGQPAIQVRRDGVDLAHLRSKRIGQPRRGDRRGLRDLSKRPVEIASMRCERATSIRPDALAREVQAGVGAPGIRREIEREEAARHGLLVESVLRMDAAESVLLEEEAGTVGPLPEIPPLPAPTA